MDDKAMTMSGVDRALRNSGDLAAFWSTWHIRMKRDPFWRNLEENKKVYNFIA